jgi:ABC-type branched-subunit amino acid transport system substrate-binding protein
MARKSGIPNLMVAVIAISTVSALHAQKGYDQGASDTEIRIGNIMPYSGPASAYASIGRAEAAYFSMINAEGGINGRKITFISYDDAFSPPKAVEQTRKLVESDDVLLVFQALGTASNAATRKYLNSKQVPQLFVGSGASKWGNPQDFPWTMGWQPSYKSEARVYAKFILNNFPAGKVAILWQNDDTARDVLAGLKEGLGEKVDMIVADMSYELSDPTVDSQVMTLKNSGADILIVATAPKAAAQTIKRVAELAWQPTIFSVNASSSIATVLRPAGLEASKGVISSAYLKDPNDPAWRDDAGVKAWLVYMDKFFPEGDKASSGNVYGYVAAQALAQVLRQCGDDLTRKNVMTQAANLTNFVSDMMLPGISATTSPTDYFPIEQMQLMQFDGQSWKLFGDVVDVHVPAR